MDSGAFLPLVVFGAGVLSFFAPCIVPLLPVYIGFLSKGAGDTLPAPPQDGTNTEDSKDTKKKKRFVNPRLIVQTLIFTLGLSTAFIVLGFGAGALGKFINNRIVLYVSGAIVILLGLHQIGVFNFAFLERQKKGRDQAQQKRRHNRCLSLGAYLLPRLDALRRACARNGAGCGEQPRAGGVRRVFDDDVFIRPRTPLPSAFVFRGIFPRTIQKAQ